MGHVETVRARFAKRGRLKYISHLDVTRCLSRVFSRCGLPIWYTQGFNPHPYLTFALPLPLGFESECETFDFRLTEPVDHDTIRERLNAALPPDLRVLSVAAPQDPPEAICWADYRITVFDTQKTGEALECFLGSEAIPVTKKTKRGQQEIDLKAMMTVLSLEKRGDKTILTVRLPAGGTLNVNPTLLTAAFAEWQGKEPYHTTMERLAVLKKDLTDFC